MSPAIQALLRHALTGVGMYLAGRYGLDGDQVEAAAGAMVTLASIGWSQWEQAKARKAQKQAQEVSNG